MLCLPKLLKVASIQPRPSRLCLPKRSNLSIHSSLISISNHNNNCNRMLHNKPKAPNSFLSTVTSINPKVALMAIKISPVDRAEVDAVVFATVAAVVSSPTNGVLILLLNKVF
ncbi:hypothetical protein TB2_014155 [Malus domestica]